MIAVDTSALIAIILGEPDAEQLGRIMQSDAVAISSANLFEAAMVAESRQGADAARDLQTLLQTYAAEIHPVDEELAWTAHAAWRRFGRGRHPASLNYGDCFSYALAKTLAVPLLFKGTDFAQTDVAIAA